MRICHCLFWKQENKIAAIYKGNSEIGVLKFKGERFVSYTEEYWNLWKAYSGYCSGEQVDFCFIYDEPMEIPKEYKNMFCDRADAIWTVEKIDRAWKLLGLSDSVEIRNENNVKVMTVNAHGKENQVILFSKNIKEAKLCKKDEMPEELTPFIQYYVDKEKGEGCR